MRRPALPGLLLVWAALLAWATLPVSPARAQSTIGADQKDREIADLKKEIKLLEQRVDMLEGLDQKVKVIDRKLEVQAETEQTKANEAPIINASDKGFWFASQDGNHKVQFGGIIQADGRFSPPATTAPAAHSTEPGAADSDRHSLEVLRLQFSLPTLARARS